MRNAKIKGRLDLTRVQTTADLNSSGTHTCIVEARYNDIGGALDLLAFQFRKLDLYGATVQKDLRFDQLRSTSFDCNDRSVGQALLSLKTTQVGNLVDAGAKEQLPKDMFPDRLNLEGFSVSHLDRRHTADWWGKLFELNRPYSPHPIGGLPQPTLRRETATWPMKYVMMAERARYGNNSREATGGEHCCLYS